MHIEIPATDTEEAKWAPLEYLIPFRYRPRDVPRGGVKGNRKPKVDLDKVIKLMKMDKEARKTIQNALENMSEEGCESAFTEGEDEDDEK